MRLIRWLCLMLMLLVGIDPLRADEPLPTIEEVRAKLRQWQDSFATIRIVVKVTYEKTPLPSREHLLQNPNYPEQFFVRTEFKWSDEGFVTFEKRRFEDNVEIYRSADGYGTGKTWRVSGKEKPTDAMRFDLMRITPPLPDAPLRPFALVSGLGGMWHHTGMWVPERVQLQPWVVAGWEVVDGARCLRLKLENDSRQESLWLDVDHGYLPRRIVQYFMREEVWAPVIEWRAREYRDYQGLLFPSRGYEVSEPIVMDQAKEWEVESVTRNEKMPRSSFEPLRIPGLRVIDYATEDTYTLDQQGKPPKPPTPKASAATSSAPVDNSVASSDVRAVPGLPQPMIWFGLVAFMLLAIATGLVIRRTA